MSGPPLRLAMVGWGAMGRTAWSMLDGPAIELVAVATRSGTAARVPGGVPVLDDPDDLRGTRPELVAEAAGREAVGAWGRAALGAGAEYVVSSTSAFADAVLLDELRDLAARSEALLHVHPGALAGVEALVAARQVGIDEVEHRIVKPPRAWVGTRADELCDLEALTEPVVFLTTSAAEAACSFPRNANVAMTIALAGIGPESTRIALVADPAASVNRHETTARGAFGELEVSISSSPLPGNPKTSAMAALSLVRAIRNRASAFVI